MITVNELREVLRSIGFVEKNDVFSNSYSSGACIDVNFKEKKIIYSPVDEDFKEGLFPTKEKQANGFVIHRDTTLNFNVNENFVCLICVHFLLKKGYEAKHIVFEPAFKVGHVNKPSYGDILVFDKEYNPLVLIENKTFGSEFSKEWNLMQKDGGQLFSYLGPLVNEMGLCENLALFAVDFDDTDLIPKSHIITLKDNEKRIAELENPKTFADAKGKYFEVWSETYGKSFETKGLFENDIAPYTIGKLKYTISDLKGLSHAEIKPIYHEFATILRNNAITDFEHSFYILIDLFLCKITDELNNPEDLQFYYKGVARDTPKEYCNRLLKLYQQGKKQLFDVDVVNKEEEDIKQIFEDTNRSITNGLFAGIKELFEEIKFYNIKKFNFIDVENKEEFDMNFQILIKIAALIQDINLTNSDTNHFFGDLFEGLLSKNVHQTEGQFFTPLPIVNFIINSLPEFPNSENIKVLDYACGAGHFLTEFIKKYSKTQVYGIEKSQTLSQVAKIATIINGSKNSRIVFKDALSYLNTLEARFVSFDKESFDCIIANPPYSVKGFLETLDERDRRQFELTKEVDEKSYANNNSIECFFIERAKFYLKTNGIMGIILPSSLLSNEGIYAKKRELLFANFNILSVAVMNSRTFGSTGTNTIILFAQKVGKNAEGLLNTFIAKKDYKQYLSWEEIDNYIEKQKYDKDEFIDFMQDGILGEKISNHEIFKDYRDNFKKITISKQLQKEWFKKSSLYKDNLKEKSKEYKQIFLAFLASEEYALLEKEEQERQFINEAKNIECDKLITFIQTNSNVVALLQSPPDKVNGKTNKKEIVEFLGYDWSNRKGDEGIKYIIDKKNEDIEEDDSDKDAEVVAAINSIKYIKTPLYNPENSNDTSKFSYGIRKHVTENCSKFSFGTKSGEIMEAFNAEIPQLFSYRRLSDMIDFSHAVFNKKIDIKENKTIEIITKWPIKKLGEIAEIKKGKSITSSDVKPGKIKVVAGGQNYAFFHNESNCSSNTITVSASGAYAGFVNYWEEPIFASDCSTVNCSDLLTQKYIYYYLKYMQNSIYDLQKGQAQPHVYPDDLKEFPIPFPSIDVQKKIVDLCIEEEKKAKNALKEIEELKDSINGIVKTISGEKYKLGKIAQFRNGLNYKKTSMGEEVNIVSVADFKDNKSPIWQEIQQVRIDGEIKDDYLLHKNDLLTVRSNGSQELVGRFMYIDQEPQEKTSFSGFSIRVRPDCDVVISEFLYYLLSSRDIRNQLTIGSNGSNIKSLNQTLLSNIEIPIPSIESQKEILEKLLMHEKRIVEKRMMVDTLEKRKKEVFEKELV